MDKIENKYPSDMKRTRTRLRIWGLLTEKRIPLTCSSIYEILRKEYENISFSTVFRNLESFVEKGYIEKVQLFHQENISYQLTDLRDVHYGVCVQCHQLVPFLACPFEDRTVELEDSGFRITKHRVEVMGYCSACQKKR